MHANCCIFLSFPKNEKIFVRGKKKKWGKNCHRWNLNFDKNRYGPHFEDIPTVGNVTNITVPIGNAVYLNCRISLLQDKTVCNSFAYIFVYFFHHNIYLTISRFKQGKAGGGS